MTNCLQLLLAYSTSAATPRVIGKDSLQPQPEYEEEDPTVAGGAMLLKVFGGKDNNVFRRAAKAVMAGQRRL
jgi:hypothetical protein